MVDTEYQHQQFVTDAADAVESWDWFLQNKQGRVGLIFHTDETFYSDANAQAVGPFQIVDFMSSDRIDYRRSDRIVRGDGDSSYRLLIPLAGAFRFEQGESRELFHPGKLCFFHWGRPMYMTHGGAIRALIMTIPERTIDLTCAANAPLALEGARPLVRMLETQVKFLAATNGWTTADFSIGFSSALKLLEGTLQGPGAEPGKSSAIAERARFLIESQAHDRTLTPASIARTVGVSAPTLYRIFKSAGYSPVATMLRDVRLERAHRRLITALPADMDRIAAEEGFPSTRRFREAYRERYGQTPAEVREQLFDRAHRE